MPSPSCTAKRLTSKTVAVMKAPRSYTTEDTVEINCHGGVYVVKRVLETVIKNGARPADPGEFTKRAFLNGKLDLTKAESVMGLISARNDAAAKISRGAREGRISRDTEDILNKLLETAASLAAFADYPDEDIEGLDYDNFLRMLTSAKAEIENMLS